MKLPYGSFWLHKVIVNGDDYFKEGSVSISDSPGSP